MSRRGVPLRCRTALVWYSFVMGAAVKRKVPVDHVESTLGTCGGKPRIRGTRIRISQIASEHEHMGRSPDEIINAHPDLTLAEVHAALTHYYDHREEIQAEWREADALISSLQKQFPARRRPRAA